MMRRVIAYTLIALASTTCASAEKLLVKADGSIYLGFGLKTTTGADQKFVLCDGSTLPYQTGDHINDTTERCKKQDPPVTDRIPPGKSRGRSSQSSSPW